MPKTASSMTELLRAPKRPHPQAQRQPDKARQHRYERRKTREIIRLCPWQEAVSEVGQTLLSP